MILRHLPSFVRKCINFNKKPQKLPKTKNSMRPCGRKWLIWFLLLAVISVFYIQTAKEKKTKKMIYILTWTPNDWYPFSTWKTGQEGFIEKECLHYNCFVTNRRRLFGGDLTKFDAIAFNARNFDRHTLINKPRNRSAHQKYIFINTESSDNNPICHPDYDGFFNWTATYRLDSDIVYSYIQIKNSKGIEIGPKINITWSGLKSGKYSKNINLNKNKAVAWVVSNCATRSKREIYAQQLKEQLKRHKLTLDIYGRCGNKCEKCMEMLNSYYFYLAFENSFAEDYVTEKLLIPLQNNNVPIVFGGANYSRFLPPGSYLDARKLAPRDLAATIARLIDTPADYKEYLRWRMQYRYQEPHNVCRLCAALNNDTMLQNTEYKDLRKWWNPDYKKRCSVG